MNSWFKSRPATALRLMPSSVNFEPSTGHVDIWRLSLDEDIGDAAPFLDCLNREEQSRADTLKAPHRRKQFIMVQACLKKILAGIINKKESRIHLPRTGHGKPYIDEQFQGERIYFTLAHSNGQAVIALTLGQELGVDIEKINPDRDCRSLSRRFFSAREQAALSWLEDDELCSAFYACWARKEAFIKAEGSGVAYGLGSFDVSVAVHSGPSEITLHRAVGMHKPWFNISLECEPDYAGALAVPDAGVGLRYRTVQWN